MSLLGHYTTGVKKSEALKDFHLTVIHRIPREYVLKSIGVFRIDTHDPAVHEALYNYLTMQGIESFFVGGGTKKMFSESTAVRKDDLHQPDAEYLIINPIWKGLDAVSISKQIMFDP